MGGAPPARQAGTDRRRRLRSLHPRPAGQGLRGGGRRRARRRPRHRRRERHRRPGPRAARRRRRARRRGDLPVVHLLRHGRGDRRRRRRRRSSPTSAPTTTSIRRPSRRRSRRARAPSSPSTCSATRRDLPALRALCDRARPRPGGGCRPGVRRRLAAAPRSATSRRSRSSRPRTCRRSATAGSSRRRGPTWPTRCRTLRFHGSKDKQTFTQIGYNSRLDELHAAVLRVFLRARRLERRPSGGRRAVPRSGPRRARRAAADGAGRLPPLHGARRRARALVEACKAAGIGCGVYYARPLHLQPVFAHLAPRGNLPRPRRAPARGSRCRCSRPSPRTSSGRSWRPSAVACLQRRATACGGLGRPHERAARRRAGAARARPRGARRHRRGDGPRLRPDRRDRRAERPRRRVTGRHGGGGRVGKARAAAGRVAALDRWARGRAFDAALAHGSTDQPIVARALRIPATTMFDYEYAAPAALAQLPARPAHAGARGDPARPPAPRYGAHGARSSAIRG